MKLVAFCLFVFASFASFAHACDESYPVVSLSGRRLIDCRVNGETARLRYLALTGETSRINDADGGFGGFVRKDAFNYCFASAHLTTFQCSQFLDASTGLVVELESSVR